MTWRVQAWAATVIAVGGVAFGQGPARTPPPVLFAQPGPPPVVGRGLMYETPSAGNRVPFTPRRLPDTLPPVPTYPVPMPPPVLPAQAQTIRLPTTPVVVPSPPAVFRQEQPTAIPAFAPPAAAFATLHPAVADAVIADVRPFASDLVNALRPSVRETAASGLAEGRHGWRPEVKQLLAKAAMTDPAVTVQAHCVGLLAALGHHEPGYVEFLEATAGTGPDRLKAAARTALAKLGGR